MCFGQPHCLLIVDDSAYIRHTVKRVFEELGDWRICCEAVDGKDGIEKAIEHKPCVIVLDMWMPGMDGIDAARKLKSLLPDTPLFMFTNYAEDVFLKQEMLNAGIERVISKMDAPSLIAAIKDSVN